MTTHAELIRTKGEDAALKCRQDALKGPQDMRILMDEELDAVNGGAGDEGYPENQAGQGPLKFF